MLQILVGEASSCHRACRLLKFGTIRVGDSKSLAIFVKETLAFVITLQAGKTSATNARVGVHIDNPEYGHFTVLGETRRRMHSLTTLSRSCTRQPSPSKQLFLYLLLSWPIWTANKQSQLEIPTYCPGSLLRSRLSGCHAKLPRKGGGSLTTR